MSLFLYEIVPADAGRDGIEALLHEIGEVASSVGGEIIESQVTGSHDQLFVVVEAADAADLATVLTAERLTGAAEVAGPDQVRLVGAELAEIKAARPKAGYLVEWDFPADLDMDTYLGRKKANAPKYAEVPEVSFLRTYVREDMVKCLCLYDAPDEGVVRKAREVVNTPIDRLHALERSE
ncbi:Protein of unknown function [Saccharopolyspora kobensis]|uniref:DUF4242 domain-containing protein n=1 Tax=Saccharopolyspora kobensis TaxID=146035 RepID=A0A1H6AP50_9PSEU|nr:DUF4242 domain-containing protein [Saccharopolyspora kobensis]SEG50503.1 Protein of unknown function [Saccharopolyspora kobensis]SFE76080.1 Protein of unknown function [Saccharopolyspora kobensis]